MLAPLWLMLPEPEVMLPSVGRALGSRAKAWPLREAANRPTKAPATVPCRRMEEPAEVWRLELPAFFLWLIRLLILLIFLTVSLLLNRPELVWVKRPGGVKAAPNL